MSKIKNITLLSVIAVLSVLIFVPNASASTEKVRFRQMIRPLPCGVDHITDIDGQDRYFAPRECGKLVVPTPANTTSEEPAGGVTPVNLDTKRADSAANAYLLVVKKGLVYTFRLQGDSSVIMQRTMTIDSLQAADGTMQVRFSPGDKIANLVLGGRLKADLAYDPSEDIDITFVQANPSENSAILRVWFPVGYTQKADYVHETRDSLIAGVILGSSLALAFYLYLQGRKHHAKTLRNTGAWHSVH